MSTARPRGAKLLALTTSALCLPAYSGAAKAWAEPETDSSYTFSYYDESKLPSSATNGQSGERYEVKSHQFHVLTPIGEKFDVGADLTYESMSGASPWYIVPGADGKPIQIMSGATIDDERTAIGVKARHYRMDGRESVNLGVSKENDYRSIGGGVQTELQFDNMRRILTLGASYSYDKLDPTDGGTTRFPDRIRKADKDVGSAFVGLTQVWNVQTAFAVGASYTVQDGYLSDPYKQAYVDGDVLPDSRPHTRKLWSVNAGARHYFMQADAALQVDYRHYGDSWEVASDTLEIGWHQNLPDQWRIVPSVRWYEQGRADFYRDYYTAERDDGDYSSDYRLSAYGAISGRLAVQKEGRNWSASVAGEYYEADASYALPDVSRENPGLVEFTVVSASFVYKF